MNVSLTPELEKIVSSYVESGQYATASEVMREAVRLFDREKKFFYIDSEIQQGIADIDAGRYVSVKTPEDRKKLIESIQSNGKQVLEKRKKK